MIRRIIKREIGRCQKYGCYNYAVRRWLSDMNVLFGDLFGYVVIGTVGAGVMIALVHLLSLFSHLAHGHFALAARDVFAEELITLGVIAMALLQHWINLYIFPREVGNVGFRERTRLEYEAEMRGRNQ